MATNLLSSQRIQPRRKARTRTNYNESDSDSTIDRAVIRPPVRSLRLSGQVRSYRESSDEEEGLEGHSPSQTSTTSDTEHEVVSVSNRNRLINHTSRSNNSLRRTRRNAVKNGNGFNDYKRRKLAQPRPTNVKSLAATEPIYFPASGQIPPWQTLEYQIWLDIMQYAARPVYDPVGGKSNLSVEWLLGVSKLCRSFHEAAISTLLWSPPLLSSDRAHRLIGLLSYQQDKLSFEYRNKIHALEIEVKQLLLRKSGIDLEDLLRQTPLLQHLRLFHSHDDWAGKHIWAKPGWARDKWSYGNLIDILDQNNIVLQSFEWNGRFRDTMHTILSSSERPCMQNLRVLKFVNFIFEEREEVQRTSVRDTLANIFKSWPQVHTLEFHNCNIVDAIFLSRTPVGLRKLVISNCQSLTSEALRGYLACAGNSLTTLHLSGNQVMDLGFVPDLNSFCQNLQDLHIDLSYEDSSSYRDRDPLYDDLLPNGRPTWPTQLQSIVVGPLRSLSLADAEGFYQSLVDAADDLPYLRTLSIKTILQDASWRDRASLRLKWSSVLEDIFLSKQKAMPTRIVLPRHTSDRDTKNTIRKSIRIQEIEDSQIVDNNHVSVIAADLNTEGLPRHNRCRVVEFDLSDQRPAQEQYREEDFLDDELSGDEDWRGG